MGLGLWLAAGAAVAAAPATPSASDAAAPVRIAASDDAVNRLTVPVMIDGQGPFDFVVDTGADRTVISDELANKLGLKPGAPVIVHATSGEERKETAVIDTLKVGRRTFEHMEAAVLRQADLGAAGLLGVDTLRKQTVVLDFKTRAISVGDSVEAPNDRGVIVVYGRNRYGELVLVDAHAGRIPLYVILDSGAQNTVANGALARMLSARAPGAAARPRLEVISVTGGQTTGEYLVLPNVTLGDVELHNVPIAVADLHTFARFDLQDRPAMLLGMDVLRLFSRVSVDFGAKQVSFRMPSRR